MLPVNLSYIGAAKLTSRRAALVTATSFVLGVVVVNAAFGLLSSLFFAVLVQYRAIMNTVVGLLAVLMGLWMAGIVRLSVPSVVTKIPTGFGPFVVGIVFALVASPCASPVLVTVLGVASQDGIPLRAVTAMVVYSIGYTIVLFAASLFAGVATSSRKLLAYGELITRIGAVSLVLIGLATAWYGFSLR
jgi:cytochrome c-type biogenesis protein